MNGETDKTNEQASEGDEFLTKKELAARLKVSVRTVEQWQHDGHVPYLRIAGVLLFHWPAVVKALTEKFTIRRGGSSTPAIGDKASTPHPGPLPDRGGEGRARQIALRKSGDESPQSKRRAE